MKPFSKEMPCLLDSDLYQSSVIWFVIISTRNQRPERNGKVEYIDLKTRKNGPGLSHNVSKGGGHNPESAPQLDTLFLTVL